MQNFKNNYSDLRLLAGEDIIFTDGDFEFILKPVSVKDALLNSEIMWLVNILDQEIDELQKNIQGYIIKKHLDFLVLISTLSEKDENIRIMAADTMVALESLIPGITFTGKAFKINDRYLDNNLFDDIVEVIFKTMKKEKIIIREDDDDFTKKEKRMKLLKQKIKNSKTEEDDSNFEDLFASILYEFPQYKLKDIYELNLYTFYYLIGYIGKIENYEVEKISAGNGLLKKGKKLKYFIDK